jgi:hypothetical protein
MDVTKMKRREILFHMKSEKYEYMTTTDQRMVVKHHSVIMNTKK